MFSYFQHVVRVLHEKGQMGLRTVFKVEVPWFFIFAQRFAWRFLCDLGSILGTCELDVTYFQKPLEWCVAWWDACDRRARPHGARPWPHAVVLAHHRGGVGRFP